MQHQKFRGERRACHWVYEHEWRSETTERRDTDRLLSLDFMAFFISERILSNIGGSENVSGDASVMAVANRLIVCEQRKHALCKRTPAPRLVMIE